MGKVSPQEIDSNWMQGFVDLWFDDSYQISIRSLESRGWCILLMPDVIDPLEAEWFSNTVARFNYSQIIYGACEYHKNFRSNIIDLCRDTMLKLDYEHCADYVVITNRELQFLYYKDQSNQFFMFCGDKCFLKAIFRCTHEAFIMTYRDRFCVYTDFDQNTNDSMHST